VVGLVKAKISLLMRVWNRKNNSGESRGIINKFKTQENFWDSVKAMFGKL